MDLYKLEMYPPSMGLAYDPTSYMMSLDDLPSQTLIDSPVAMPWMAASDSASTSEEPSSPFSSVEISPMSPRDDEESFSESTSYMSPLPHDVAMAFDDVTTHFSHSLVKKRRRDGDDQTFLEAMPAAKVVKAHDDSLTFTASPLPTILSTSVTTESNLQTLIAQQYSWNQFHIQQAMACLSASQIQQVLSLANSPPPSATCASGTNGVPVPYSPALSVDGMPTTLPPDASGPVLPVAPQLAKKVCTSQSNKKKSSVAFASASPAATASSAISKKRPKLDPKKDALQCLGHNRKKNKQCGNAALMEFIGPRPRYCAEHIDQDPTSLYTKCCSTHHKLLGEGKGCREVVLKELGCCHKHFDQISSQWPHTPQGLAVARATLARVSEILELLEAEAISAKKSDPDLFQRKHKIIPKFVHLLRHVEQWILDARTAGVTAVASADPPSAATPSVNPHGHH